MYERAYLESAGEYGLNPQPYLESAGEYGHVRGVLARVEALLALDCPFLVLLQREAPDGGLCLAQI